MEVEVNHEGSRQCSSNMRELQDRPPEGRGAGHLLESPAQAKAGMNFPWIGKPVS